MLRTQKGEAAWAADDIAVLQNEQAVLTVIPQKLESPDMLCELSSPVAEATGGGLNVWLDCW